MSVEGAGRRPSMMDVARLAGVSHQTVSRVINAPDSVRPGTRERVQRAIEELGYRRTMAARALVTDSTRTIGVTTAFSHFFGPASTATAIEDAARAAGYACLVSALRSGDPEEVDDLLAFSVNRGVDGIIALAPRRPSRGRRPGPPGRSRSFSSPTGSSPPTGSTSSPPTTSSAPGWRCVTCSARGARGSRT